MVEQHPDDQPTVNDDGTHHVDWFEKHGDTIQPDSQPSGGHADSGSDNSGNGSNGSGQE